MSMRYLRKVQNHGNKTNDLKSVIKVTENLETSVLSIKNDDNDNDELVIDEPKKKDNHGKSFNVYNFFSDLNTDDNNDDSDTVDNDTDQSETQKHEVDECDSSSSVNRKKKKRKNLKKKVTVTEEQNDQDIDVECQQFSELCSFPSTSDSQNFTACLYENSGQNEILKIKQKYLNADNELKKLCGSKSEDFSANTRKNRTTVHNNSRSFRKMYLTESCKWSPSSSSAGMKNFGLSMFIDNDPNNEAADKKYSKGKNNQYFVYVHDDAYKNIQKKFYAAVESKNHQNIISLVASYPYHVDSLIQFSEICKLNEDLQMSAEFIERALRCLEFAFHPSFNIITGNCRLSYKKQTNRVLFIALFRHLNFIAGRACYRTSLELCKVLLSFDPDSDPLACVLIIDWLSLCAKEYQWFINFCHTLNEEKHRNLTQLPNIAYSLAFAHFQLDKESKVADNLLQDALFMFPDVLSGLIDKCGIKPDKKVLNHKYFFNNNIKTSKALKKLEDLYVARSYHLWKNTSILAWLESNVHTVIKKIDSNEACDHIKHCKFKRKKRYQGPLPRNISRHIILSDIKEITVLYPEIQSETHIFSFDPLPPADSIDTYDHTRLGMTERVETNSSNSNALSLFISSLFPFADENGRIGGINNHADNEPDEFD